MSFVETQSKYLYYSICCLRHSESRRECRVYFVQKHDDLILIFHFNSFSHITAHYKLMQPKDEQMFRFAVTQHEAF